MTRHRAAFQLGLIFSRNVSLASWVASGLFDREKRIYEEHLEQRHVQSVAWFTYGSDDCLLRDSLVADGRLHSGVQVYQMPRFFAVIPLGSWLYSVILPWIHVPRLAACSVLKTNQMDGAWAGCLAHLLVQRPLFLRTGYTWSVPRAGCKKWFVQVIERQCVRFCSVASVSTEEQRNLLAPGHGQRIQILPNYIDTLAFRPLSEVVCEERRALAVGRLDVEKNLAATIAGLRAVGWGIDLVGTGPLETEIRQLASHAGPEVRLLGTVANGQLPQLLNRYQVYVLCSHVEGLPKSLLEAMACGLRCVGTPVPGIDGLLTDGVTGYLSRDTSARAIGEAVVRAASGMNTGHAARRLVEQRFALSAVARRELCILRHLLRHDSSEVSTVVDYPSVAPGAIASHDSPHENIRVSVLLCVHNGLPYLPVAVTSILRQTMENFELVVINDGSTDGSSEWLDACVLADKRVRVFHQTNMGLTKALNVGLQQCRAPYVARMDADDVAHHGRLGLQADWLDRHRDHVLLGSAYHEIDAAGVDHGPSRVVFAAQDSDIRKVLGRLNPFFHSAVMFRRDLVMRLGGYDPTFRLAQDYDLWIRLARRGRVANLPVVLAWRRFSPEMLSIRSRRRQLWHGLRARSRWFARSLPDFFDVAAVLRDLVQVAIPQAMSAVMRRWLHIG